SSDLSQDAKMEIERLHGLMVRYPELFIEVTGHTDSKGTPLYNFELSKKRANAVTEYLISRGIDPLRFVCKGVGETENIALNTNPDGSDNPEGRKINRNARIRILRSENQNLTIEPEPVPNYLKPPDASKYTVLLTASKEALPSERFGVLNNITQEEVVENYNNSTYLYTIGTFYSEIQAREIISTFPFKEFPQARIIRTSELEAFSGPTSLINQSESQNFSIQLYALKNPVEPGKFSHLSGVKTKKCSDGFYRVIFGEFNSYDEAKEELPELKNRGFYDAFIVDMEKLNSKIAVKTSDIPVEEKFIIQLRALSTKVSINYFNPLSDIEEVECQDGLFRYIYGEFDSLESAKIELERLKKKGYPDAFIRKLSSIPGY
ncbi:MAG: OmpA family protein, partial [Bacteroidales bacterium]